MKELVKISRVVGYIEKIFRAANERYFENEVEMPVITVSSKPSAWGACTVREVWIVKGEKKKEMFLSAEWLNSNIEEIVDTVIHEMVHLYCAQKGIKDVSRGGAYHNEKFKNEAEKRSCAMEYNPKHGWNTKASEETIEFCIEHGFENICMNRALMLDMSSLLGPMGEQPTAPSEVKPDKKESSTRKYQCPCCKNSVRATKAINIVCGDCNVPFELI